MTVYGESLIGKPVYQATSESALGAVQQIVVDLQQHVLVGLSLDEDWSPNARLIPFEAISYISDQAVSVRENPLELRPLIQGWLEQLMSQPNPLGNLHLYVPGGMRFGRLLDVEIEIDSGAIVGYVVGESHSYPQNFTIKPHQFKGLLPAYQQIPAEEQLLSQSMAEFLKRW